MSITLPEFDTLRDMAQRDPEGLYDAADKPAVFSDEQIDQLMAYVQANGGGPTLPSGDLRDGDLAEGGELFRLNCASCHNFTGRGGALSQGNSYGRHTIAPSAITPRDRPECGSVPSSS